MWRVEPTHAPAFRIKHGKGVVFLEQLLSAPEQQFHVLAVIGDETGAQDAGPVLDVDAKRAYQARIAELDEEVEEAEAHHDFHRVERARAELDKLAEQLAAATGLGGRDRRAASNVQRARNNVQRRIKDTIQRIGNHDAALGRYLEGTVKTGVFCSFEPL